MANEPSDTDNFRTSVPFIGKHIDPSARVVFIIIGGLMVLSAVFGNSTLLFIVVKHFTRNPKKFLQDLFIANLALVDLLTLGYWFVFFVLDLDKGYHPVVNGSHCTANGMIVAILHGVSMESLVTISFNRYLHVCHFHLYRRVFTLPKTVCWCLLIWVVTVLLALPPLWGGAAGTYQYNAVNHICSYGRKGVTYPKVMAIVYTIIPPFFLAYFNFAIFRYWRKARMSLTFRYPLIKDKEQQRRGKLTAKWKGGIKYKMAICGCVAAEPSQEEKQERRGCVAAEPSHEQKQEHRGCVAAEPSHEQKQERRGCVAAEPSHEQKQEHRGCVAAEPSHEQKQERRGCVAAEPSQERKKKQSAQLDNQNAMGLDSQSRAMGLASLGHQVAAICLLKQQGRALSKTTDDKLVSFNVRGVTQLPHTPKGDDISGSEVMTPNSCGVHVQDVTNDEDSDESRTVDDSECVSSGDMTESQEGQPDDYFSSKTGDTSGSSELQESSETSSKDDQSKSPTQAEETDVDTDLHHSCSGSKVSTQTVSTKLSNAPSSRRCAKERMSSRRRKQQNTAAQNQRQRLRKKHQSKDEAFVRSLVVVSVLMFITTVPYSIVIIVDSQVKQPVEVHIAVCTLLFFNNSVNWVVYGVMNQAFRKGYTTYFRQILNTCRL